MGYTRDPNDPPGHDTAGSATMTKLPLHVAPPRYSSGNGTRPHPSGLLTSGINLGRRLAVLALTLALPGLSGAIPGGPRVEFKESMVPAPASGAQSGPRIVRRTLTPAEMAEQVDLVVSLRMRDFADFESRIQSGQAVSGPELEARYLPLRADYDRVASWLVAQGLTVTLRDRNHTNLVVRGSVGDISGCFGVTFARVATADGEFSSAITAPSVPGDMAGAVLDIGGLQPHILMHAPSLQGSSGTGVAGRLVPADVLAAYNAPIFNDGKGMPITGSGQTIGIIMAAAPLQSDLTAFWQAAGISDSVSNYALANVGSGPTDTSQTNAVGEATLDVDWASGMASGAAVRLYAIPSLSGSNFLAACTQILNDGDVSVASYSACGPETDNSANALQSASQTAAQLAAAGISLLASSGDGGSNPNPVGQALGYDASNPLVVDFPASNPYVTGVGGTTMALDAGWDKTSEAAWTQIGDVATNPLASGGGISSGYTRPVWQSAPGVPAGSMRCVPDLSAVAETDPSAPGSFTGGLVVLNGKQGGYVGTSLSAPIWAGVVALTNQYRASVGLPNIGLLNRWAYALIGSNAFYDASSGTNGAYTAGAGYDLCTGAGSPNIAQFIYQTTREITKFGVPTGPVNTGSPVSLSVTPQFLPSTYQWRLNGVNIAGATGSIYHIPAASAADSGAYSVVITNVQLGPVTYSIGSITVRNSATNTTRLINISTRAQVGTGGNILIPGFVISGSGLETLLIRADGPSLTQFGVSGALAKPSLSVFNSAGTVIASNTVWGSNPDPAQISSTASAVGAFAFSPGSADCALIATLAAGAYTVQVSGVGDTTGVALAEVYEVSSTGTRLINVSTRTQVGTGGNILIPGFVIGGSGTENLLVRADGPGLTQYGVSGVLAQPSLSVLSGQTVIASNTGWGTASNSAQVSSVGATVGAFALASGSLDSATIVQLQPGAYTAQISGVNGATGVALAEIYEAP